MPSKKRKIDVLPMVLDASNSKNSKSSCELQDSSFTSCPYNNEGLVVSSFDASIGDNFSSDFDSSAVSSTSQLNNEAFESIPKMGDLPDSINLMQFAECRASEIAHMMEQFKGKRKKLGIQQLPHHMRRRAASHNANRVPRRLREKSPKESRRHRRRPSNLLQEHARRERDFVWLETHIWFAKRFKMQNLWGYKIPIQPNDKSTRAAYRASSQYVMLQDLSYYCCIELAGPQSTLLRGLLELTTSLVGHTFASRMYLGGAREGQTILYHPRSYPYRCIGPVSFLWKPLSDPTLNSSILEEEQKYECPAVRQLWIWCHPTCHEELVAVIQTLFLLKKSSESGSETSDVLSSHAVSPKNIKLENSNIESSNMNETYRLGRVVIKTEKLLETSDLEFAGNSASRMTCKDAKLEHRFKRTETCDSSEVTVTMTLLKDTLVRHRLIGPLSHAVIVDALKPYEVDLGEVGSLTDKESLKWWEDYYQKQNMMSLHAQQKDTWKKMQEIESQSLLPSGVVIGLSVKDPRLDLPKVNTNSTNEPRRIWQNVSSAFSQLSSNSLAHSPLWDETIRNVVTATKEPESKLNEMRSRCLVPGTRLDVGRDESCVPVIAIQQPGHDGFASGWDIIAPLGWSMPFWIAFVYRGARACGLRELRSTAFESSIPLFPYNFPDSNSGGKSSKDNGVQMMAKHDRYPPDKRPSFEKLGIKARYSMPWATLAAEWLQRPPANAKPQLSIAEDASKNNHEVNQYVFKSDLLDLKTFFVFREKKKIDLLQNACAAQVKLARQKIPQETPKFSAIWSALEEFVSLVKDFDTWLRQALICVKVKCVNKGKPCEYSGIYLLDQGDLKLLKNNPKCGGPVEPVHQVKKIPCHKKMASNLNIKSELLSSTCATSNENSEDRLAMQKVEGLITHCDRKLIGFVEVGEFSFTSACGCGLGHCSLIGFLEVLRICSEAKVPPTVLVRMQDSFQYRIASIEVVSKLF